MEAVDVLDLMGRPGASQKVHLEEEIEDLVTEVSRVPGALHMDLLLESVVEGILVSGTVGGRVIFSCARCLTEASRDFRVEVTELFTPEPEDRDEEYPLADHTIDLEPMVRDAVLLSLPFSPLCRPDCRGLCERCGGDRNRDECTCPPRIDPRWAVLDQLDVD